MQSTRISGERLSLSRAPVQEFEHDRAFDAKARRAPFAIGSVRLSQKDLLTCPLNKLHKINVIVAVVGGAVNYE